MLGKVTHISNILEDILKEIEWNSKGNSEYFKNLRFVVDIVLPSDFEENLQRMIVELHKI